MTDDQIAKITEAATALLDQLNDCSEAERLTIGERIRANFRSRYSERTSSPHYGTTPGDGSQGTPPTSPLDAAHGFELLQVYLAAAAGDAWQGWPSKGDA